MLSIHSILFFLLGLLFESGPFTHFGTSALTLTPEDRITYTTLPVPSPPSDRRTSSAQSKASNSWWANVPVGYFVPDFTVAVSSDVLLIQIHRAHYLAGLRATAMERHKVAMSLTEDRTTLTTTDDIFQQEMEQAAKHNVSNKSHSQQRTSGMIAHHAHHHGPKKEAPPTQDIPSSHPNITYRRMQPVTLEARLAAKKMELINNQTTKLPTIRETLARPSSNQPNKEASLMNISEQNKKK